MQIIYITEICLEYVLSSCNQIMCENEYRYISILYILLIFNIFFHVYGKSVFLDKWYQKLGHT